MLSNRRNLKAAAHDSLTQADFSPKKLILIHTGAALLLSVLLMTVDYLLNRGIGATAGLGGMQTRAMLSTVQSVLQLAQTVALPFWQVGYLYAVLKIAKGETATPDSLLQGFRRFGSVLRLQLLTGIILMGLIMVCSYGAGILFALTPWGKSLVLALAVLGESSTQATDPTELLEVLSQIPTELLLAVVLVFCGVFLVMAVPIFFRMRFASYIIMDGEKSALAAMRISRQITKGNCMNLLKLDFSFWWYYALEILLVTVCYGDMLLAELGVALPWSGTVSYFLCFGMYAVGQLALHYACRNQVEVTYAHAYGALRSPIQVI